MILRLHEEMKTELRENMRGGRGSIEVIHMMHPEEMCGNGRLLAETIIPVGGSIGLHQHVGEIESYIFWKGKVYTRTMKTSMQLKQVI